MSHTPLDLTYYGGVGNFLHDYHNDESYHEHYTSYLHQGETQLWASSRDPLGGYFLIYYECSHFYIEVTYVPIKE